MGPWGMAAPRVPRLRPARRWGRGALGASDPRAAERVLPGGAAGARRRGRALVLPITEAPRRRAPRVDWEPGFGSRSTSVLHMGATELCLPEPDDELEIDGAGDVELVVEHPGPSPGVAQALRRAPIKIEVVSDDEDGGDWCNPYLS